MDVLRLNKKAFALGKKFSELKEAQKLLRKSQTIFYIKNSNITDEICGRDKTNKIGHKMDEIERKLGLDYEKMELEETEKQVNEIEMDMIDVKIQFFSVLSENNCCEHDLIIKNNNN